MTRFKGDSLPSYYAINRRNNSSSFASASEPHTSTNVIETQLQIEKEQITPPSHQPNNKPPKKQRPSLSQQLALISGKAQELVDTLQRKDVSSAKLTVPTASMTVGRLECKFPSPVQFEDKVCRYQFLTASRDIAMFMYYCDMEQISFEHRMCCFRFKIGHALNEFGTDYDPSNRNHFITIGLASRTDFERVKTFIYSKLQLKSHRRRSNVSLKTI